MMHVFSCREIKPANKSQDFYWQVSAFFDSLQKDQHCWPDNVIVYLLNDIRPLLLHSKFVRIYSFQQP